MKSGRDGIIRAVLDAYDKMDDLEHENKMLKKRLEAFENGVPEEVEQIGFLDKEVLKVGRKKLFEDALCYWHSVRYNEDDETGEVSLQSFEQWRKDSIKREKVPSWMSFDAFFDYFDVELRAMYEEECEKAVAEAHNGR